MEGHQLIGKLRQKQLALRLSDEGMGKRLGVSRQCWQHIRQGRRRMGVRFLRGVIAGFPELTADCLFFMATNATIPAAGAIAEAPQSHNHAEQTASEQPEVA